MRVVIERLHRFHDITIVDFGFIVNFIRGSAFRPRVLLKCSKQFKVVGFHHDILGTQIKTNCQKSLGSSPNDEEVTHGVIFSRRKLYGVRLLESSHFYWYLRGTRGSDRGSERHQRIPWIIGMRITQELESSSAFVFTFCWIKEFRCLQYLYCPASRQRHRKTGILSSGNNNKNKTTMNTFRETQVRVWQVFENAWGCRWEHNPANIATEIMSP